MSSIIEFDIEISIQLPYKLYLKFELSEGYCQTQRSNSS